MSTNLTHLRGLPRQMAEQQKQYRAQRQRLLNDPYMDPAVKTTKLQALAAASRIALDEMRTDARTRAEQIRKRAEEGEASPISVVAYDRIQALLKSGAQWYEIAQTCVNLNDRAALAALKVQLPYEVLAKKMSKPQMEEALEGIRAQEKPLLTNTEQAMREEAREIDACMGALEKNFSNLETYFSDEQNPLNTGRARPPQSLYGWVGIPEALNDPVTLSLADETTPVGGDLISRTLAQKGIRA